MLPKKLFLSSTTYEWADIVIQHFRTDHLQQNTPVCIFTCGDNYQVSDYLVQIDTALHMNIALRTAMQSDILFLDIRDSITQLLIEYLRHLKMERRRIICVSSILSWSNTHSSLLFYEGNLQALSTTVLPSITDSDFVRRMPTRSHHFIKQLEDRLFSLDHDVSIVSCGLIYGRSYQQLQAVFELGLRKKQLICQGDGNNMVPMIHVDDLGQLLCELTTNKQKVVIAADSQVSQMQLLKRLQKQFGLLGGVVKRDKDPQTYLEQLLALDVPVRKSQLVAIRHSFSDVMKDYSQYRQYDVKRYRCKNNIRQLSEKYMAVPLSDEYIVRYLQLVQKGEMQDEAVLSILDRQEKQTKPQSSDRDREVKQRKSKTAKSVGDIGYSKQMILQVLGILLKQFQYVSCIVSIEGANEHYIDLEEQIKQDSDRVSILKDQSEDEPSCPKLLSKDSRRLSIRDREARKVVMSQYLLDTVMPKVSQCLSIIQSTRPPNIFREFIRLMREQAAQHDNFT